MYNSYLIMFLVIFCIIIPRMRARRMIAARVARKSSPAAPEDIVRIYKDRLCVIYTEGSTVKGTVAKADGQWLTVIPEKNGKPEIINSRYISRVKAVK